MNYSLQGLADIFAALPTDATTQLAQRIKCADRIFLHGAGRSGLMLRALAMRLAQAGFRVHVVGDTTTPAIGEGDLLLLASASGKTPGVVRAAQTAKEVGSTVFAITASTDSPLSALCDGFVYFPAPNKDSVGSASLMGTLFEQALLLFGDATVEALDIDPAQMRARHANLE